MKKHTGSFDTYNFPSNNLKLKSFLSIITMGIFIFLGFASLEEESTVECDYYNQPITKTHEITIGIYDKETKSPITNRNIKFQITEYKKIDDPSGFGCTLEAGNQYPKTVLFGSSGKASFTLNKTYVSADDEIKIYFDIKVTGYNDEFELIKLKVNDLKPPEFDYFLLEIDEYP